MRKTPIDFYGKFVRHNASRMKAMSTQNREIPTTVSRKGLTAKLLGMHPQESD